MHYVDIIVRISPRTAPTFGVSVSSPQGSCESTLALPFRLEDLAGVVFGVAQTVRDMTPVDLPDAAGPGEAAAPAADAGAALASARAFGEQLFDALFQGKVRSIFDMTTAAAQVQDGGVRLRLSMDLDGDGMADVASLPWELMRPRDQGPLVVSNQTLLVRSPDVVQPTDPKPFAPPLRILLVSANPRGSAALNLEEEKTRLSRIWGPLPDVKVDVCAPVIAELLARLRDADYHVIHYMGHGLFDQKAGRGMLAMATEQGDKDLVSGEDLALYLRDELPRLRLVFLNACKTATTGARAGVDPFAGVATALIQAGVPAVVAMQFPISDRAAIAFAETFYQRIAKGDPVDVAMAEGRKTLWRFDEWATPVLFLRSKDGVLFERPPTAGGAAAPPGSAPSADDLWGEGPADAPRVYVATACESQARAQRQIAKKLRELGVRVVDSAPREEAAAHAAFVQRAVRGSDLSVHLLGDHPGAPLDDSDDSDSLRTFPMQELTLGIEAAPSQLVLIPDSVDVDRLDDAAYAARIQELIRMPRAASQFELVMADRNQLAAETLRRVERLKAARASAAAPAGAASSARTALVDVHPSDLAHAHDLLRFLTSRGLAWALTSSSGAPSDALAAFEDTLRRAQLYIVVFGAVAREWVDHRLDAALQRGADADSVTRCIGVYLAPPARPAEATRFGRFFDVADNMTGFEPATVEALIARASR